MQHSQATTIIRRTSRFRGRVRGRWWERLLRLLVIVLTLVVLAVGLWGVAR